ncbi:MAG: alpha-L-fucosidase [Prolixibacteraceae bacterium]|nr:alpha-L-fucosidase [Prolixibacteraceae bacterium]
MKNIIAVLVILSTMHTGFSQEAKTRTESMDKMWGETTVSVDALKASRGKLFDESNFGMFIHWGLFSHLGGKWQNKTYYGIGEWIMNPNMAGIPVKEYRKIAKEFNPVEFNAKAIAQLAKNAGMKYIIITSKHHEGFAMFDSKADPFNIVAATPFARDPMKELSVACHELGLGFGFYYSHNQDWTSPGGSGGPILNDDGTPATFEEYFYRKCKPQVKEICTNYGPIDFVWFDTPGNMKKELVVELVKMVRELQPNAMLCSRVGHGMGDYASKGDMEVPPSNIEGLWETCDTNNDSWSFAWYDNNFKSPKEILHRLVSTVGRGGTYLFNVGPDGMGKVPEMGAEFLLETGKWLQKYPQVVYGAGSSPWGHALPWGDVTTKGNSMYLSVFEWPQDGKLYIPGMESKVVSAKTLNGRSSKSISFEKKNEWLVLNVPFKPLDSPVSVIELKLDTNAETAKVNTNHGIYPNIQIELLTEFAEVTGAEKEKVRWMEKFGEWKHVNQISKWSENSKAVWTVEVFEPGYYYLDLRYKGEGKLVWKTITDEGILVQNQQAATEKYVDYHMGIIEFKTAGKHTISVNLVEGNPGTSSLESIKIFPIK